MTDRYLIVGLGNPGPRYQATKHNVGFMCVDALARAHGLDFEKKHGKTLLASGTILDRQVLLAKPQSFMNLSGDSVGTLMSFYKIAPEHLMAIFDDLDLPLGTLRIRESGGSGGHKGMKHIIERLGTQEFSRIRFGIGRPPGRMDPAAYVLLPFKDGDENILVAETIDRALKAIQLWLSTGIDRAMNEYNGNTEDMTRRLSAAGDSAVARNTRSQVTTDQPQPGSGTTQVHDEGRESSCN
jgi:PTH1 family peptidyl-tRNA hydrolase